MEIRRLEKADFDHVVQVVDRWWGGPMAALVHPIFHYEFGDRALVAEEAGRIVGFLFGFVAGEGAGRVGYVHLVGVHPEYRQHGAGRALYERFMEACRESGVHRLKAISPVGSDVAREFHEGLGFRGEEVPDYAGPGRARVVFARDV